MTNVLTDERNFFNQSVKSIIKAYYKIRNDIIGAGDNHTTGYLLDYPYFKEKYKIIVIDLSKQ